MGVFEVEIGPRATAGTFAVRVVNSAAGEATETVALDLDGLLGCRTQFQQALLMSSLGRSRGCLVDKNEEVIQQTGKDLFDALLGRGEVAGLYRSSAALAASSGEGLRVVVRIEDPRLAGLPWEAMYDAKHGRYICRGEQLVRHVPVAQVTAPLTVRPPLRVLVIAASPRGLPELNVAKEKDQLTRALDRLVADGLVDLHWVDQATWSHLHHLLLSGTWHVVHFIGHGDFDERRDTGLLALVGEDGYVHKVSADRFVDLLRQAHPMPRLVLLNSCAGAAGGQLDLFAGTAAALVRGGVTAVAAMQFEITDAAAIAFSRGFYEAIAYDRGVDDAVSSGRTAILGLSDQTLEWVTPVLYLRGDQTRLFTLTAAAPSGARTTAQAVDELILNEPSGHTAQTQVSPDKPRSRPSGDALETTDHPPLAHDDGAVAVTAAGANITTQQSHDQHQGEDTLVEQRTAPAEPGRLVVRAELPGIDPNRDAEVTVPIPEDEPTWYEPSGGTAQTQVSPDKPRPRPSGDALETTDHPPLAHDAGAVAVTAAGVNITTQQSHDPHEEREKSPTREQPGVNPKRPSSRTLPSFPLTHTLIGHTAAVWGVAFSPDGRLLATASSDKTVRLWNPVSGKHLRTLTGHTDGVRGVAFSPDGHLLATASSDKTVRLWNPLSGKHLRTLTGHTDGVRGVAFSPDGRQLATASSDKTVRLWALAKRGFLRVAYPRTLTGHTDGLWAVAFSPDGRQLATASSDKTVRLWETVNGQYLRTLAGHTVGLRGVAFSPDGRLLATGSCGSCQAR